MVERRRALIRELLKQGPIASQESLRQLLAEHGVEITQATLSRDLRELDVVKGDGAFSVLLKQQGILLGASTAFTTPLGAKPAAAPAPAVLSTSSASDSRASVISTPL